MLSYMANVTSGMVASIHLSEQRTLFSVIVLNGVICITNPDFDSLGAQGSVF